MPVLLEAAASAHCVWRQRSIEVGSVECHSPLRDCSLANYQTQGYAQRRRWAAASERASRGNLTIGSSDHAEAVHESREDPMSKAISDRQSVSPPRVAQPDR